MRALLLACVALAALSLLLPSVPTYDPWAWIIWGREITEGALSTTEGPSWKPFPVLFTTPFALLGDVLAPKLWLVVARAGGLLAIAMAYRLSARLAGRWAGLIAAGGLLLADQFVFNFARGNSEGLLVAFCLWAVERHLDGRRLDAFLLGFAAALLRPEVWPFWGLYGLWLAFREPRRRLPVAGCFAALLVLWFVPEYVGSGNFLRAAVRARQPTADSAAFAAHPFLEVFARSSRVLMLPVLLGGLIGAALPLRALRREGRGRLHLALALGAAILMVAVAAMTQGGFAGNLRYVALPAALVCVLAGAGWVELGRLVRARLARPAAAAAIVLMAAFALPYARDDVASLREDLIVIRSEADFYGSLRGVVDRAGGPAAVRACGGIFTGDFQVQALAYYAHVHGDDVDVPPEVAPPGTVFAPHYLPLSHDRRFPLRFETARWVVRQRCGGS